MNRTNPELRERPSSKSSLLFRPQFKALALSLTLLTAAITTLTAYAVNEIPFVVSAYNAASTNAASSNVTAKVTIKTVENTSGVKELVANGKLAKSGDSLVGVLPMTVDKPNVANQGTHALNFSVTKTGRIGLQWMLNGKPRDGRDMRFFETTVNGNTLVATTKWWDANREITVSINRRLIIRPGGGGVIIRPLATPTPRPRIIISKPIKLATPTPKPKVAVGRILNVTTRLYVTNSDDGFRDDTVEVLGGVRINGQVAMSFDKIKAQKGQVLRGKQLQFYYAYNTQALTQVQINGMIQDHDKTMSSDTMWMADRYINLRQIADSGEEYLIKGDGKSESADLYIRVTKGTESFQ